MKLCSFLFFNLFINKIFSSYGDYDNLEEIQITRESIRSYKKVKVLNLDDQDLKPGSIYTHNKSELTSLSKECSILKVFCSLCSRILFIIVVFSLCLVALAFSCYFLTKSNVNNAIISGGIFIGLVVLILTFLLVFKCRENQVSKAYQATRHDHLNLRSKI